MATPSTTLVNAGTFGSTETQQTDIIKAVLKTLQQTAQSEVTGKEKTTQNVQAGAFGGEDNRDGLDGTLNLQQMARSARVKAMAISSPEQMLLGKAKMIDDMHGDSIKIRDQLVGLGMDIGMNTNASLQNANNAFNAYKRARFEIFKEVYPETIAEDAHNKHI